MSAEIRPFKIDIPQADIDDLRDRLSRTRWPTRLTGGDWGRGVPVDYLKELVEYWRTAYNWREHEARLNEFPQYTTEIEGQTVHFLHVRSPEPDAVPLIITHSWPNSIVEFMSIIGPLVRPREQGSHPDTAFHVVAPSLPGFGFSPFAEPADESLRWSARIAGIWGQLMSRLGYGRYGAHGNDAGALVSPELAVADSEHVIGVHMTGGIGMLTGDPAELEGFSEEERGEVEFLTRMLDGEGGSGYAPYLARRPQTLAYGFADSPVMQLAYLVERFKEFDGWPEGQAAPHEPIDRDQLLTNATVYWLTNTGGSSSLGYENAGWPVDQTAVPTGVSHGGSAGFRRLAERGNTIVHWSEHESPSHMVAMADPEVLAADIREFFGKIRG